MANLKNKDITPDVAIANNALVDDNRKPNREDTGRTRTIIVAVFVFIAAAVVIMVAFGLASDVIEGMLLNEKLIEKELEIDLITEQIDLSIAKDGDWESAYDHYVYKVMISMEMLDRVDMTYAAVFDEQLQNISARSPSYEGSLFEPERYPQYLAAVKNNESGNLVLPFMPAGSDERDMHLHFQWIPSDASLPNRLLSVVAISRYTINTRVSSWVQASSIILIVALIIIVLFTWRRSIAISVKKMLEETVKQRTAELEEQTISAQKASTAKSDFLSNMSHEMRTPMNAIIGMTTIARNSDDISRKDYCLSRIEDASGHLLSVINDILDMSKIEANKFELSIEKFNFERVLQKVANVIGFRVDEKKQLFTVFIDEKIPQFLIGDDQRIMQVITNLMSNAVKFTPDGGSIQLNAYLVDEKDNACTVKVEVIDTGIGISAEQQSKLFSSFVQAENSTTRKFGGTGLGLAISKHIVEMMGGEIWIRSALGKGSAFSFTFRAEHARDKGEGLLEFGVNWQNMSVLVVDDTVETREYFSDIMRRFGSQCDVAGSGSQAIEMIQAHGPYNLYFVDWKMPEMDGIELAQQINELGSTKSIVIMISAAEWEEVEYAAKNAGISRMLSKPLFPSTIADCINECLGSTNVIAGTEGTIDHPVFKGHRILLAEDVEVNREIVLALLEPTELAIDTAENGRIALEMFRDNPDAYDMIFMDVQMPEMDGYTATRNIRALNFPRAREIPIVAMTANVFNEDVEKCLACGMVSHVGKPIDYDRLIESLQLYLR